MDSLDAIPPNDSSIGTIFLECDHTKASSTFLTAVGAIISEYTHDFKIGACEKDLGPCTSLCKRGIESRIVIHGIYRCNT